MIRPASLVRYWGIHSCRGALYRVGGQDGIVSEQATPADLRATAARARRFASLLADNDPGRQRLLEYAVDLEARADRLEAIRGALGRDG
jgi:hypothetical protein